MFYVKSTAHLYASSTGATKEKKEAAAFRNKHEAEAHLGLIWNKLPLEGHWEVVKEVDPDDSNLAVEVKFERWLHNQGEIAQHDYIKIGVHLVEIMKMKNPNLKTQLQNIETILNSMI